MATRKPTSAAAKPSDDAAPFLIGETILSLIGREGGAGGSSPAVPATKTASPAMRMKHQKDRHPGDLNQRLFSRSGEG